MVREVVATVQPMMAEKNNKLVVRCPSNLGIVSTDQTKLRQAALNLLSNAAKFTEAGHDHLSVQRRKHQAGDWIEIQVQDTGIGISESEIAKTVPEFRPGQPSDIQQIWRNGPRSCAEPETLCADGRRHLGNQRAGQGSCFTIRVLAWMSDQRPADEPSIVPGVCGCQCIGGVTMSTVNTNVDTSRATLRRRSPQRHAGNAAGRVPAC